MKEKLYELMDWAGIEALVYSEEDHPEKILGAHVVPEGVLIQCYVPAAESVSLVLEDNTVKEMEEADGEGFYAILLPGDEIPQYRFRLIYKNGAEQTIMDPYLYGPVLTEKETAKFNAGVCYDIYDKLGAHMITKDGVKGVHFAVWAPDAKRVSLVGDFNNWDGRSMPMKRLWDSGIFELFVPGLAEGSLYKYEIKAKGGLTFLKADPYGSLTEICPGTASVVNRLEGFEWSDAGWMAARETVDHSSAPMAVYELHLGSFRKPEDGRQFFGYRELGPMVASYVKKMGYTHVELMPVTEHPAQDGDGYQTTGYFAPASRYGTPHDLMCFVNYLHGQGIGVIMDWVPSQFPRDVQGLVGFDGTCLYEHQDPRQGVHPLWNTLLFNYGRPEVKNFLIGSALFWSKIYHIDGLRLNEVSSMLYLDYAKSDGQWIANMYGGNENLEAVEFIKHLTSIYKKMVPGGILIAEESSSWPGVTAPLDEGGLGFDFKWNEGWLEDTLGYMQLDPVFRSHHHGELTFSMVYHYSENYLLPLSHDAVVYGKGSFYQKMPGKESNKLANLRAFYGYTMMHPGKKMFFMGQDAGVKEEWRSQAGVDWEEISTQRGQFTEYMRQLLQMYRKFPALSEGDYRPEGFEWINNISANENMLVFLRKTEREEDTLLVVCNFSNLAYEDHKIGVPFPGKYKEIFNSDREEFGGKGHINPRQKNARRDECDAREYSIRIMVPPLGISVFSCTRVEQRESANEAARSGKAAREAAAAVRKKKPARKGTVQLNGRRSLKDELARRVEEEETH